jgi:Thrombospondin type 3 repeat
VNGKFLPLIGLVGLLVAMALWATPSLTQATTFAPAQPSGVSFSTVAPGANPDVTVSLDVPPPSTIPNQPEHIVTFGDGDVATAGDAAIPTGAYMGSMSRVLLLSIANEGCVSMAPVTTDLVDASTPATTAFTIAQAGPPTNRLANLAEDDGDLNQDLVVDVPAFAGNGIADGADAYPTFVAASLDPDGAGPATPIAPLARYFGVHVIANSVIGIVQLVVMPPGALATMPNLGWMQGPWGFPMLAFFDNPLSLPSNDAITSVCNFNPTTSLLGIAADNSCTSAAPPPACTQTIPGFTLRGAVNGGCPGGGAPNECGPAFGCPCARVTNPPGASVLTWRQYAVSQRDWDSAAGTPALGDGHTNYFDTCPLHVDPAPVAPDADGDGIFNSCDPGPPPGIDHDGDGWNNRLDNCPLAANPTQAEGDIPIGTAVPDGGSRADDIGTACDPAPAGANGHYHATALAFHICIGPAAPACAGVDADGDGIANVKDNCISGANPPPAGFAQSQRDFTADGFVDVIGDIAPRASAFGTTGGNPAALAGFDGRFDLNYSNSIDIIGDIAAEAAVFGAAC